MRRRMREEKYRSDKERICWKPESNEQQETHNTTTQQHIPLKLSAISGRSRNCCNRSSTINDTTSRSSLQAAFNLKALGMGKRLRMGIVLITTRSGIHAKKRAMAATTRALNLGLETKLVLNTAGETEFKLMVAKDSCNSTSACDVCFCSC